MSFIDDQERFRRAERHVRQVLFGDGVLEPGRLKGEKAREDMARALRHMREAFDAVLAASTEGREHKTEAKAPDADLEVELTKLAAEKARSTRSANTPKKATSHKRRTRKKAPGRSRRHAARGRRR
jgi:hypothetical protein